MSIEVDKLAEKGIKYLSKLHTLHKIKSVEIVLMLIIYSIHALITNKSIGIQYDTINK